MRLFGTIEKVEETADGHLLVSGVASSEAVDSDGEVILASAMKEAIPEYMKFGCLREMHQPSAAGTAVTCEVREDGRTYLEALVVDPVAKEKVRTSTYKGFSIGGKVLKRTKNIIEALRLVEISLVDRPANPEATFALAKMEDGMDTPLEQTNPAEDPTEKVAPVLNKAEDAKANLVKWAGEPISDASAAINCLDTIFWLLLKESAEGEAEQAAILQTVVDKLRAFIAAEIMEPLTPPAPAGQAVALAEGAGDLEKAGAKYSKATREAIKALRGAITQAQECMKAFDDMPEDDEEGEGGGGEDAGKGAAADDLQKAETAKTEALAKVADLEGDLAKAHTQIADLQKQMKEQAAKLAEKPLKNVPVEKSEDGTKTAPEPGKAEPQTTDPLALMKRVHSTGGKLISTNSLG